MISKFIDAIVKAKHKMIAYMKNVTVKQGILVLSTVLFLIVNYIISVKIANTPIIWELWDIKLPAVSQKENELLIARDVAQKIMVFSNTSDEQLNRAYMLAAMAYDDAHMRVSECYHAIWRECKQAISPGLRLTFYIVTNTWSVSWVLYFADVAEKQTTDKKQIFYLLICIFFMLVSGYFCTHFLAALYYVPGYIK